MQGLGGTTSEIERDIGLQRQIGEVGVIAPALHLRILDDLGGYNQIRPPLRRLPSKRFF